MDDLPGVIVCVFVTVCLAVCGVVFIFTDTRHFNAIEAQCKQQGYIQNETTRILCSVEEKK